MEEHDSVCTQNTEGIVLFISENETPKNHIYEILPNIRVFIYCDEEIILDHRHEKPYI